ncbi:MAG: cytidine deaminase, partial [Candidatus Aenigmarchaeota archaeon]|nr:cytidine deaminase [Candidatus Aenigmarchaeota archaeon]
MSAITNEKLIRTARKAANLKEVDKDVRIGGVGCALISSRGRIYKGTSVHACCGVGFCAEYGAIAAMLTNRDYQIKKIAAVSDEGAVMPPCGKCRELMYEINQKNLQADVI